MFEPWLDAVRSEASGERALESVRALARFHRVQASPGYDAAAEWLCRALREIGLTPEVDTVPGDGSTRLLGHLMPQGWEAARARAILIDGERREPLCDYQAARLSLILRSAEASGRFPLVDVGEGVRPGDYTGADVRGAVVLTRGAVQRVHELAVVERGAAGLLSYGRRLLPPVRTQGDDPDSLAYTSFWWGEGEPRGWGFVVSPRTGERLAARLAQGAPLALEVAIDARAFATTIPLVSASLPGEGAGEVLVLSHLCHPEPSANDNASGVAATLETARVLSRLRAQGPRPSRLGIRFLWMPEITGTHAWLARDPERARRTVAALNLDMVGEDQERCGSTLLLEHPPHFAASFAEELLLRIRARALDWVTSYSGPGHYSLTRLGEVPYSGGSDHAVLIDPATGIPCPMLIQWPDRYYHSSYDTPDRTSPASLALAVRCAATYAGFLAGAGEREQRWLLGAVERGARRRLLAAVDDPAAARLIAREQARGERAIESLARLGMALDPLANAGTRLADFCGREAPGPAAPERAAVPQSGAEEEARFAARPRRAFPVPIHFQRHLLPGWRALPETERETWRAREQEVPDGALLTELAWYACDGRRTIAEIARLLWRETGHDRPDFVADFFALTGRLGLSNGEGLLYSPARRESGAGSSEER